MKKALTPLTVAFVLCTGYSWNWLQGDPPRPSSQLSAQEMSAAVLRHKSGQPTHWRAMFLNQN
jgi:hypothetical protein